MAEELPIPITADRNAIIGGFVDEETFFESCIMEIKWYEKAYSYIIERTEPQVVFAWFWQIDEFAHRMFGFLDEESPFYSAEKYQPRFRMFRKVYQQLDKSTHALWESFGGPEESNLFIVSDHGFASVWKVANVNEKLSEAGLYNYSNPKESKAIAYVAGGAAQIYINLEGREPTGVVSEEEYSAVQKQIVELLESWKDGDTKIMAEVFTKEETKSIVISERSFSMYNESTTGDVVAFAKPSYQFDAASPGQKVATMINYFNGQHGYLHGTIPEERGDIRCLFAAGGVSIKSNAIIPKNAALVDIVPTVASILGIREPADTDGKVLSNILK
jgi:predicted AlkP superfamily phosphohydrolase/phosphomutase